MRIVSSRPRPWLLALLTASLGCGARTEITTTDAPSSPADASCENAFACPDGQRCDDGVCRPDTTCPAAIAPRLLYDASSASFASWTVPTLQGRDFVHLTARSPKEFSKAVSTEETLVDLSSNTLTRWPHVPGAGFLFEAEQRVFGAVHQADTVRFFLDVHLAGTTWQSGAAFSVPPGHTVLDRNELAHERVPVVSATELRWWTPATGALETIAPLDGHEVWRLFTVGSQRVLITYGLAPDMQSVTYFSTLLEPGAKPTPLFELKAPLDSVPILFRAGEQWFAMHVAPLADVPVPGEAFSLYRLSPQEQVLIGKTEAVLLPALALELADQPAPSTTVSTLQCQHSDSCWISRVALDTLKIELLSAFDILDVDPDPPFFSMSLQAIRSRWLACGAVDVLLGSWKDKTDVSPRSPSRLWYARLVPSHDPG